MLLGMPMQTADTIGITTVYTLTARPSSGRSPFVHRPIQERVLIGLWTPATSLERGMIVLEGQDVICFLLSNGPGDLFLTPHRVDRHNRTLKLQQPKQHRNSCDVIRCVIDSELT